MYPKSHDSPTRTKNVTHIFSKSKNKALLNPANKNSHSIVLIDMTSKVRKGCPECILSLYKLSINNMKQYRHDKTIQLNEGIRKQNEGNKKQKNVIYGCNMQLFNERCHENSVNHSHLSDNILPG